jgi:hypothetical protein
MQPIVSVFFHRPTDAFAYVVEDPLTREAVIIDSVLDYEPRGARIFSFCSASTRSDKSKGEMKCDAW